MKLSGLCKVLGISLSFFVLNQSGFAAYGDVPADHPYRTAIEALAENEVIESPEENQYFRPNAPLTRAEIIKMIINARFEPELTEECIQTYYDRDWWYVHFPDVPTDSWFGPYVCIAQRIGMVSGHPDGSLRPYEMVSLSEAAKMLVNALQISVSGNDPWYRPYVEELAFRQAVPTTLETFTSPVTRGEFAEIIYRLAGSITTKPSKAYSELANYTAPPCDNCLVIPQLNLTSPIVFDVGMDALVNADWARLEQELMDGLRGGVVHYPASARPGEKGNLFLTGHSSFYTNDPGQYKYVFAKLGELEIGDTYEIYYHGRKYSYKIFDEKVVSPQEVSVLHQPAEDEISTLMTCDPPGTNVARKIFKAKRI